MSKFSISCNTQSSKFTVTVDSEHIWNSETQNQTWHKSTKTSFKLKVNLLKMKGKAILYTIQENDWFWSIISLMAKIAKEVHNHHWNEIRWNELHIFYLYFTEELQPNSQGRISKKVTSFFFTL